VAFPVAIIGATGYTGGELLRLLVHHPTARVVFVGSRSNHGQPISDFQPHVAGLIDLPLEPVDPDVIASRCRLAFLAVPRGAAMDLAGELVARDVKVIDLGTDFRFKDQAVYKQWYGLDHTRPDVLEEAVYGLTELFRQQVAQARVVGNPGCYPTATSLAIAPLAAAGKLKLDDVAVTAMSGVSGAGRDPKAMYHLPHATENVQPYGVASHRHTPEIEMVLSSFGKGSATVSFTPHLVPMSRGILSTCILTPSETVSAEEVQELYDSFYEGEPFVRVLPQDGPLPHTKAVLGSNRCDVAVRVDPRSGKVIALAAIDNLVKGAAGQAIQNMNVMMGWDETAGLRLPAVYP